MSEIQKKDFAEVVKKIAQEDPRYETEAYLFVRRSLDFTWKKSGKTAVKGKAKHISGRELLDGIRELALEEYGPMTKTLFENWGIKKTDDFGQIVFNLVNYKVFGKSENDSPRDFENYYNFKDAFLKPFQPKNPLPVPRPSRKKGKSGA